MRRDLLSHDHIIQILQFNMNEHNSEIFFLILLI